MALQGRREEKRKFNGKTYFLAGTYTSRVNANTVAKQYRDDNFLVRLIWSGKFPLKTKVYVRKKKR